MKNTLFVLLFVAPAAFADWKTPVEIQNIRIACNVPPDEDLGEYAASTIRSFLKRGDVLNTAFLQGLMWTNSGYECMGLCIAELAKKEIDKKWEPRWDVVKMKVAAKCAVNSDMRRAEKTDKTLRQTANLESAAVK